MYSSYAVAFKALQQPYRSQGYISINI